MLPSVKITRQSTIFLHYFRNAVFIGLFFICLLPFSLSISGSGVSANYFYLFFPFIFILPGLKKRLIFRRDIALIFCFYLLTYLFHLPFDFVNSELGIFLRFGSFLIFIVPLTLAFIEFDSRDIYCFKMAILFICLFLSAHKLLLFATLSLGYDWYYIYRSSDGFITHTPNSYFRDISLITPNEYKRLLGSQRYGFLLIFGFFIALLEPKLLFRTKVLLQRFFLSIFILLACFLTFSRATMVSLVFVGIYFLWNQIYIYFDSTLRINSLTRFKKRLIAFLVFGLLIALLLTFLYINSDSTVLNYYKSRFIEPFMFDTDESLLKRNSSEGYRIYLFALVIDYVLSNPLFGSGYKGLASLYGQFNGIASVHNQYLDVLLRVGIVGAIFWFFLLFRIFQFCKNDRSLFYGFIGIIIFGLFHETFRLSYGSFIFGMLLSFSYSLTNSKK
jgi:O-antigen ligase